MQTKDSPAMTDFDAGTGTESARHVQWRKLSRKRRRTLIHRSLRKLEKEAKRKSVFVGMEDYSHVQSLVFSELPYNPNGHHCSCNCLDEVVYNPELELYGWTYGKQLKSPGLDYLRSSGGDDTPLRHSSVESAVAIRSSATEDGKNETQEDDSVTMEKDQEESISSRKEPSSKLEEDRRQSRSEGTDTKQGCHCDQVVSRGNTSRNSITKHMIQMGASPGAMCQNCRNLLSAMNRLKNLPSNKRVSIAKDDGTLRSRIFALRQKLRQYNNVIQRNEYMAVQERVKRRLTIGDKLQKKALSLSDKMKIMKFRESFYWNKNKELEERLFADNQDIADGKQIRQGTEKGNYEIWRNQGAGNEELEEPDGISDLPSDGVGYMSPRKAGRRRKGNELPAVIEEEEEITRGVHTSDGRIEHCYGLQGDDQSKTEPKHYDILFINHSDSEVDGKSNEREESSEDSDNFEDDDDFARSWPTYKSDALKSGPWKYHPATNGKREKIKDVASEQDSIRRLVHRLDSGLSFGPADAEILQDEALVTSVNRVEEEKTSKSNLPEDDNGTPLVERQRSFGEAIRGVIREEIYKDRRIDSKDVSTVFENQERQDATDEEINRRRRILEENLSEFVEEAQQKNKMVEELFKDRDNASPDLRTSTGDSSNDIDDNDENEDGEDVEFENNTAKRAELVDLTTLRTLAQKHQTFKSLRNLDEEMYQVSEGMDKLNKFRMMEAKARTVKDKDKEADEMLPLSQREQDFSIPDPINRKSTIEERIMDNKKTIAKIDYNYDLLRDLRFLILNQNTSRAFSYSYLNPAPPYLRTKWQKRIKRGFLRGVKEQKVNEVQLEKVEDVTLRALDRKEIHKVTLKNKANGKKESSMSSGSATPSRLSTARRSSSISKLNREGTNAMLPPLKLPSSRASSSADTILEEEFGSRGGSMLANYQDATLQQAFKKLEMRHKFLEKTAMMKNVIRLSSNVNGIDALDTFRMDSSRLDTDRALSEREDGERFTSRLKSNRRQSIAAVQNIAIRDQLSGRMSVNSTERRRFSLMNPIQEY